MAIYLKTSAKIILISLSYYLATPVSPSGIGASRRQEVEGCHGVQKVALLLLLVGKSPLPPCLRGWKEVEGCLGLQGRSSTSFGMKIVLTALSPRRYFFELAVPASVEVLLLNPLSPR